MAIRYRSWRRAYFMLLWFGVWTVIFVISILDESMFVQKSNFLPTDYKMTELQRNARNSALNMSKIMITTSVPVTPPLLLQSHYMSINFGRGRLGNQIFQFAALIGVSSRHGYIPVMNKHTTLHGVFINKIPKMKSTKSFQVFHEKRAGVFDPLVHTFPHNVNWTLNGYFQSWKYFANSSAILRQYLQFKRHIVEQAKQILPSRNKTLIGVHVRRGDMNSKGELKRGYNVADETYMNKSMTYFRRKYGNVQFVVVSDDLVWCRKHVAAPDVKILRVSREVDLAILSMCDHNIVTSGSFGWWGAWLAGGETVYFSNFPRNGTWLDKQYNKEDYYPPNWIGM